MEDSTAIEAAFERGGAGPVAVEGTRFVDVSKGTLIHLKSRWDVDLGRRVKRPVYWTGADQEVRRASWFHRSAAEGRYRRSILRDITPTLHQVVAL